MELKDMSMEKIASMHGEDFEALVMYLYKLQGYNVVKTPRTGDFGVDLVAEKLGVKIAIQCKRQMSAVSIGAIQEVYAGKNMYSTENAIVVTSSRFTKSAITLSDKCNVSLIDGDRLIAIIEELKEKEFMMNENERLKDNIKSFYDNTNLLKELLNEYDLKMSSFEDIVNKKIYSSFTELSKTYDENVLTRYKEFISNTDDSMRQYVRLEKESMLGMNSTQSKNIDKIKEDIGIIQKDVDESIEHINEIEENIDNIIDTANEDRNTFIDKIVKVRDTTYRLRAFVVIGIVLTAICLFKVYGG